MWPQTSLERLRGAAAWRPRRPKAQALFLDARGAWDGEQDHAGFATWCSRHAGARCELLLSSTLLHEVVCDPALPLADDDAVLAYARTLLESYHGEVAAGWPLAAWASGRRRGASALHGLALAVLRDPAQQAGVSLVAVRPWWSRVLQRALAEQPALRRAAASRLLVVEGTLATVLDLEHGELVGLALRRLQAASGAGLDALLADLHGSPAETCVVGYGLVDGGPVRSRCIDPMDTARPAPEWLGSDGGVA